MIHITQAVIFAGGRGTRLKFLTDHMPKPMMSIHGKPLLQYLIEDLQRNGIKEIILLVGYLHEQIEEYFKDGKEFGLSITYSYLPEEAETGTRLKHALPLVTDTFLLLYGDNFWPLRLKQLISYYGQKQKNALVVVYSNFDHYTKNNISLNKDGFVELYDPTRQKSQLNGVEIGYCILNKKRMPSFPKENFSFTVIMKQLAEKNELTGFLTYHKYVSLTTPERLPAIEEYLRKKKVVFLDRDGVINKKAPKAEYITEWKDFEFLPKVKEALLLLKGKGYDMYIISNQSGIARKMLSNDQLTNIHQNLKKELKKIGITLSGIYICPHGWDEGCWCRKPKPGMLYQAASEHCINLYNSIFIGDDIRDEETGKAAGCTTYLITNKRNLYTIVQKYL